MQPTNTDVFAMAGVAALGASAGQSPSNAFVSSTYSDFFSVMNDATAFSRCIVSGIWIDNLLYNYNDLFINGRSNKLKFQTLQSSNPQITAIQFTIIGTGYTTKTYTVNINSVKASTSASNQIRIMGVGDSLTAGPTGSGFVNNLGASDPQSWGWYSRAIANAFMDAVDLGITLPSHVILGHFSYNTRTFSYGGTSITVKGGCEAIGGRCACNFLRHALFLTSDSTSSNGQYGGAASWALLGLVGHTGTSYTGTATQNEIIRTTIQGKYAYDYNADIWNALIIQSGWTGGSGTYTGSTTQNGQIDTFMTAKYANPDMPFFSLTKAQTGGVTNAFSFSTYLSRWKTLADDGVTRLVVGSTAGSLITSGNLNSFDVCTPTHICLNLGENDRNHFSATAAAAAADVLEIANTLKTDYPAIKVAMWQVPNPGTLFPERYDKDVLIQRSISKNQYKYDLRNTLIAGISNLAAQKTAGLYYVPTFEIAYPLSHTGDKNAQTDVSGNSVLINGSDVTHPGLDTMNSVGDQLYAWLYYTFN